MQKSKYLFIFFTGEFNIISVDWENLAGPSPFYFYAAENSKPVGYRIGDFVDFLINTTGAKLEDVHPIGFSLGAQVVGHLGYRTEGKMSRITGLDPAGNKCLLSTIIRHLPLTRTEIVQAPGSPG